MKSKKYSPLWPYLAVLACMFVMCVTAPRAWQRIAVEHSILPELDAQAASPLARKRVPAAELDQPDRLDPVSQASDLAKTEESDLSDQIPVLSVGLPMEAPAAEPIVSPAVEEPVAAAPLTQPVVEVPQSLTSDTEPSVEEPVAAAGWPLPRILVRQLTELDQNTSRVAWAAAVLKLVRQIAGPDAEGVERRSELLAELRQLVERKVADNSAAQTFDSAIERARYSLIRWLAVWEHAAALEPISAHRAHDDQASSLADAVNTLDAALGKGASGSNWRNYLQVMKVRKQLEPSGTESDRRKLARMVIDRIEAAKRNHEQAKFVSTGPIADYEQALRTWAAEDLSVPRILERVEAYEVTGLPSDARIMMADVRSLGWAVTSEAQELGEVLETHYLNANLRAAATATLANRLLPQPPEIDAPVNDYVVRVPVYGRSRTFTKLSVRFVPDAERIRIGLEATGSVSSDTLATSGPATFRNEGRSTFLVRKLMVLGPRGLAEWPAISEAENNYTDLVALETDYDGVPLVGALVRGIARSQIDESRDEARLEVEYKVAQRARAQLDAEVRPRLVKAAKRIEKEQLATLKRLKLELTPLGLATTEERAVARVRLASLEQVGAHTPRPRAPADSWFSMQVHQSALNNVLEQLDLDGREFKIPDLFRWIAEKLDRPQLTKLEDLPDDVWVKFAPQNAVRLRCEEGRVEVIFAFAELVSGSQHWRNFTVRTHYRPQAEGLDPRFVRDATIYFDGKGVRGKPVPVLRAIFSKVLSKNRDLRMLSQTVTSDPRLQGLAITQFVVEDGWLGVAYSPRRTVENVVRRPK
jgi:hypothetical protein